MSTTAAKTTHKVVESIAKSVAATSTATKIAAPEGKFKLYYFPINARGFAARVALTTAGFDFEDIRIKFDELKELRKGKNGEAYNDKVPLGQLPVLVFPDGEQTITQSNAIARFAGKYCGLYPSDPLKALVVDEIMDAANDFVSSIPRTDDEAQKKILREKFVAEQFPKYLNHFTKRLEKSGGPFILGENLSIADLALFVGIDSILNKVYDYISPDLLTPYKAVLELHEAVKTHPIVVQSKAIKTQ